MLMNLLFGLSTVTVCLWLQSLLVLLSLRYYSKRQKLVNTASILKSLHVVGSVLLILILGNLCQVSIWAVLFVWLGEFTEFSAAFYHSAVNFSTLGYGDFVMSEEHKLLGPIEAINGVIMIGVSTAALMAIFHDALKKTIAIRRGS